MNIIKPNHIKIISMDELETLKDYSEGRKKFYDRDLEVEGITYSQMPRFYTVSYVKQHKTRQLNL